MVEKRKIFLIAGKIFFLLFLFLLCGCGSASDSQYSPGGTDDNYLNDLADQTKDTYDEKISIGFLQYADIPALDSAREAIVDALANEGFVEGENLFLEYRNAGGDFAECVKIAEDFLNMNVDLIVATATPAIQAVSSLTSDVPVVFAAVTDPVRAGVVESWERPNNNVTGVSDLNPVEALLDMAVEIMPATQKIGVIYNSNEINSLVQVEVARKVLADKNIKIVEFPIEKNEEFHNAFEKLVKEVDIVWLPSDNTVMSGFPLLTDLMIENRSIVIGSAIEFAEIGAVCATGFDYYDLGYQAGIMVAEVIRGRDPADFPIQLPTEILIAVNLETSEKIGYRIPFGVLLSADKVYGTGERKTTKKD